MLRTRGRVGLVVGTAVEYWTWGRREGIRRQSSSAEMVLQGIEGRVRLGYVRLIAARGCDSTGRWGGLLGSQQLGGLIASSWCID